MNKLITLTCITALSLPTFAESKTSTDKLSIGAGINYNRIDNSMFGGSDLKANGFQVFGGYDHGNKKGFDLSTEVGAISTEDFDNTNTDADGIWIASVIKKELPEINNKLAGLIRIGYGVGGDDGLIMGFGAQLRVNPAVVIRLEYLNKDITQSYQANAVYHF
ncbi:MAG: hypothetical protein ACI843_001336 [Psychrobacter glaciei]|jgi:hypothetical protein